MSTSRDLNPLPIDTSGNGPRLRTLVYDAADAPMLRHAMVQAAGRALVCGGGTSINRLKHYQAEFGKEAHEGSSFMGRDTDLTEIAIIATAVPEWSIHRVRHDRWSDDFTAVVTVGSRTFRSKRSIGEAGFEAIVAMLSEMLPVGCERRPADDVDPVR